MFFIWLVLVKLVVSEASFVLKRYKLTILLVDWILSQSITTFLKLWALGSRQERSSSHGSISLSSFEAEAIGFCPLSATSGRVEEDFVQVNFCTSSNNNFQTTSPNLCEREDKAVAAGDQSGRRLILSCAVFSGQ